MSDTVLHCSNLCKEFKDAGSKLTIFKDINLNVAPKELVAIVGASGSGKSTLLHLLGALEKPTSGQVFLHGHDLAKFSQKKLGLMRNKYLGFIYQFHHLLPEFTALENVCMPLFIRGIEKSDAVKQANDILKKVGLGERTHHKPAELSGGEKQRVAFARAIVTRPKCILADEPTGNLDPGTADRVFGLMLELNRELGTSTVVVTHDLELAKRHDRVLHLEDGHLR